MLSQDTFQETQDDRFLDFLFRLETSPHSDQNEVETEVETEETAPNTSDEVTPKLPSNSQPQIAPVRLSPEPPKDSVSIVFGEDVIQYGKAANEIASGSLNIKAKPAYCAPSAPSREQEHRTLNGSSINAPSTLDVASPVNNQPSTPLDLTRGPEDDSRQTATTAVLEEEHRQSQAAIDCSSPRILSEPSLENLTALGHKRPFLADKPHSSLESLSLGERPQTIFKRQKKEIRELEVKVAELKNKKAESALFKEAEKLKMDKAVVSI